MRLSLKPAVLALATLLALGTAGPGIGADEVRSVRYVCPDGERFSVEYKRSHARLRNGSGVFSLSAEDNASDRYSDGNLVLSPHDGGATLQRAGQTTPYDCLSEAHRS
jgi:hypothetical protein